MKRYGKENVRGGIYCAVDQNIVDAQLGFKLCKEIDKAYLIYQNKLNKSIKNRNQREVHLLSVSNDGVDGNKSLSQKKIIKKNDNQANDKSIYVVIHSKTENNKNKQNGYVKEKKTEKINQETSSFSNDMKRKVIASGVNRKASPQKKLKGGKCAREECGATVIKMSYGAICSECGQRYIMKRKK